MRTYIVEVRSPELLRRLAGLERRSRVQVVQIIVVVRADPKVLAGFLGGVRSEGYKVRPAVVRIVV